MSATAARAMLRPSRLAFRRAPLRHASTTSEAVSSTAAKAKETASQTASKAKDIAVQASSKAKETASQATSKASEGLTRVSSSAGSALSRAGSAASETLGRIGGRTGRMIQTVQSFIPPAIYYSKVGLELSKMVFRGQKMSPPTMANFQSYFQPLINAARNPASLFSANPGVLNPQQLLHQMRNMTTPQLVSFWVVMAELLGFFTIGEMMGKRKIVGYTTNDDLLQGH